jgi:hypothetical protein
VRIYRSWWRPAALPVTVYYSDRVRKIKERIEGIESIPVAQQRLFFGDRELDDQLLIGDLPPPRVIHIIPLIFGWRLLIRSKS